MLKKTNSDPDRGTVFKVDVSHLLLLPQSLGKEELRSHFSQRSSERSKKSFRRCVGVLH